MWGCYERAQSGLHWMFGEPQRKKYHNVIYDFLAYASLVWLCINKTLRWGAWAFVFHQLVSPSRSRCLLLSTCVGTIALLCACGHWVSACFHLPGGPLLNKACLICADWPPMILLSWHRTLHLTCLLSKKEVSFSGAAHMSFLYCLYLSRGQRQ